MKHQPELDGLRGIAIILVVTLHIAEQTKIYFLMKAFAPGWIGVDLFFVLSGFLITSILLQSISRWETLLHEASNVKLPN